MPDNYLLQIPEDFQKKLRILHSIDGSVENLSVKDICERSGISRSTFYRYFGSQEEFCYWYILFCCGITLDQIGRSRAWKDGMRHYFQLLHQEREALKVCTEWSANYGCPYLESHRKAILHESLSTYRNVSLTPLLEFQISTYVHTETWITFKWLRSSSVSAPEQFADQLETCVPKDLYKALIINI